MKLYRVVLRGMTHLGNAGGVSHGDAYVVAENPDKAYIKLKDYLDKREYGFWYERELDHIHLLAEEADYPNCGKHLFL